MKKASKFRKALEHARNYGMGGRELASYLQCEHHDVDIRPLGDSKKSATATCTDCGKIVAILNDGPRIADDYDRAEAERAEEYRHDEEEQS